MYSKGKKRRLKLSANPRTIRKKIPRQLHYIWDFSNSEYFSKILL